MLADVEFTWVGKVPVTGVVVKLSGTPARVDQGPPALGEGNVEVYDGLLGLWPLELDQFRKEGVI